MSVRSTKLKYSPGFDFIMLLFRIVSMIPISKKEPDKISIAAFADSNLHWNDNLISSEFPFMWISRTSIDM